MQNYNVANNAESLLKVGVDWNLQATTLIVKDNEGEIFPDPPFLLTLEHFENNVVIKREIVKVTDKNWDIFTVERAIEPCIQDDTAETKQQTQLPLEFSTGDKVSLYLTAGYEQDIKYELVRLNDVKAEDSEVLHKTGDETISWTKSWDFSINTTWAIIADSFVWNGSGLENIQSETAKYLTIKWIAKTDLTAWDGVAWYNDAGVFKLEKAQWNQIVGVVLKNVQAWQEAEVIVRWPIPVSLNWIGKDVYWKIGQFTFDTTWNWVWKIIDKNTLYLAKTRPWSSANSIVWSTLEDGLLSFYDFEWDANDSTWNHNWTINGWITFVEGVDDWQAITWNNSDSFIDLWINPFTDITSRFTIAFWCKVLADTGDIENLIWFSQSGSSIDERNTGIWLSIDYRDGNKHISYYCWKWTSNDSNKQWGHWDYLPDTNKWFLVVFQMDDTNITLKIRYQDGTEQVFTDTIISWNILWNTADYAKGHNAVWALYSQWWKHFIADTTLVDKVGVWNRILTDDEINYYFNWGYGLIYQ